MQIKNHRVAGAEYKRTPNTSGEFKSPPTLIVVHDTAGASASSSVAWLTNSQARASAHVVISRKGSITQLAPFDTVAWHAGRSSYHGRSGCNAFSIGIEFDNPGRLDPEGRAWFGTQYDDAFYAKTTEHGAGYWRPYTEPQLEAGRDLIAALGLRYPSLADVVGHWFVSPGRKVDTNPLFPMDTMLTALEGRGDAPEDDAEPFKRGPWGLVTTDGLNLRRWPSNNDNIITELNAGAMVTINRAGVYDDGFPEATWFHVTVVVGGAQGWVHSAFIDARL